MRPPLTSTKVITSSCRVQFDRGEGRQGGVTARSQHLTLTCPSPSSHTLFTVHRLGVPGHVRLAARLRRPTARLTQPNSWSLRMYCPPRWVKQPCSGWKRGAGGRAGEPLPVQQCKLLFAAPAAVASCPAPCQKERRRTGPSLPMLTCASGISATWKSTPAGGRGGGGGGAAAAQRGSVQFSRGATGAVAALAAGVRLLAPRRPLLIACLLRTAHTDPPTTPPKNWAPM